MSSNVDPKLLETIRTENQDLYKRVLDIVENIKAGGAPQGTGNIGAQSMWPPVPISGPFGNWNDIREGISYRFKKSKLKVDVSEVESGFDLSAARYEMATLQLHNLENMELLGRKESELKAVTAEIEEMR